MWLCAGSVAISGIAGCAAPGDQRKGSTPVQIERSPKPPEPSPAQRRYAHDQAYQRGLTLVDHGDFANALGAFESALTIEPNSVDAMLAAGACHESLGDPIEGVRYYRRALLINPLEAVAYTNLGTAYIKLFHREQNATWRTMAVAAWRQSLALNPDQADVRDYLSRESRPAGPMLRQ